MTNERLSVQTDQVSIKDEERCTLIGFPVTSLQISRQNYVCMLNAEDGPEDYEGRVVVGLDREDAEALWSWLGDILKKEALVSVEQPIASMSPTDIDWSVEP